MNHLSLLIAIVTALASGEPAPNPAPLPCPTARPKACDFRNMRICCRNEQVCANDHVQPYCLGTPPPSCAGNAPCEGGNRLPNVPNVTCAGLPGEEIPSGTLCCCGLTGSRGFPNSNPDPCVMLPNGTPACMGSDDPITPPRCGAGKYRCALDDPFSYICCSEGERCIRNTANGRDVPGCYRPTSCIGGKLCGIDDASSPGNEVCCPQGSGCAYAPGHFPLCTNVTNACPADRPKVCANGVTSICCKANETCASRTRGGANQPLYCHAPETKAKVSIDGGPSAGWGRVQVSIQNIAEQLGPSSRLSREYGPFPPGTSVSLTAEPKDCHSDFTGWQGLCTGGPISPLCQASLPEGVTSNAIAGFARKTELTIAPVPSQQGITAVVVASQKQCAGNHFHVQDQVTYRFTLPARLPCTFNGLQFRLNGRLVGTLANISQTFVIPNSFPPTNPPGPTEPLPSGQIIPEIDCR